jgi:FkbM family methyltransferase
MEMVPVVVICYNNYKYVMNTVAQLEKYNAIIMILDNKSTCEDTVRYLKTLPYTVFWRDENRGPWISAHVNSDIYDILPDKFIMTDPDLQFNPNLPPNFIEIMTELSDRYSCEKFGFALDISDFADMFQSRYVDEMTIYDWEKQFWERRIDDATYELYESNIDTTFCLVNKKHINNYRHFRIAGNFTAKHLPWYKNNKIHNDYENYTQSTKTTHISSISKIIIPYMEQKYAHIRKNDQVFLIEKEGNSNLSFWEDTYAEWEYDTFAIFDQLLDKEKILIDIGGWIGTTAMYGSRKSKFVYCVEADNESFRDLSKNMATNCEQNYMLFNNAIYNVDDVDIAFGKNLFLGQSKMNDSTSQIHDRDDAADCYRIKTITLGRMISSTGTDPSRISLIKVDIEGGEENILDELFEIRRKYRTPLYISFHYDWWKDKNLGRFSYLSEKHRRAIISNPFTSILFL